MSRKRTLRLRLYLTPEQVTWKENMLEAQRHLYIKALAERKTYYEETGKSLSFFDQINHLTEWRKDPALKAMPVAIQEMTLKRLDLAYKAFFRRVKAGQTPGFPKFPGRDYWDSFTVRYKKKQTSLDRDAKTIFVPKLGVVQYQDNGNHSQYNDFVVKQATFKRDKVGKWHASVSIEFEEEDCKDDGRVIGVDLNTQQNMIAYYNGKDGTIKGRPDTDRLVSHVKRLQAKLAKQEKGSNRWKDTKQKIAKKMDRITRIVKHMQHVTTTELTRQAFSIGTEDIPWDKLSSSPYRGLNRVLRQATPGRIRDMIKYKAGNHIEVDPAYTSQTCSTCGHCEKGNRKKEKFVCLACGHTEHADINAARNVRASAVVRIAAARGGADPKRELTHKTRKSGGVKAQKEVESSNAV